VPSRSKSSTIVAPQGGILLLEEYDALAAAIGSALKKFAPKHRSAIARSLAEAEKLTGQLNPELFVLDVDPPSPGLANFLDKISDMLPNARVLVIGATIPTEITAERGQAGALQFIKKPFDLAAFGAAVQALLGPWHEKKGRGTLGDLRVLDLILAHCAAGSSVVVQIQSQKRTGEIQISAGQVVHAATGRLKGEDALAEILDWSKSRVSERNLSGSPHRTIPNWRKIVLESLRETGPQISEAKEEAFEPEFELATERKPEPKKAAKTGKKIVVVDDTEMLLIFVEDTLTSAMPDLQITTALSALEGLRAIERTIPDLVLLDYSLPDFNGDELCERLLENARTARVPVLLMSGHVHEMNAAAARLPNVVAKIEKPFFSEALVDLVQRTLEAAHRFQKQIEEEPFEPAVIESEPELESEPEPPVPPPPPQDSNSNHEEQVAQRAYELWRERGSVHGDDRGDWFQAENEINQTAAKD